MAFQTILFHSHTLKILKVVPDRYIRSKIDKASLCPGHDPDFVKFVYFKSDVPIDPYRCTIKIFNPAHPPVLLDEDGVPLIYSAVSEPFFAAIKSSSSIIVDFDGSMGDNLYRANAVLHAQETYPDIRFYCKVRPEYQPVIRLIPDLNLIDADGTNNVLPKSCPVVQMSAGMLADPLGDFYSAPARYGLFLGLKKIPYSVRFNLPDDYDDQFKEFASSINLREDGHNVIFQLRTATDESRSWDRSYIYELAHLIKTAYDCSIFCVGSPHDLIAPNPDVINLCGKTDWLQTIFLLRHASHVFCCDSSVLHLCHALCIRPYVLYGRTKPRGVLGDEATERDFGTADDNFKDVSSQVSPEEVFDRVFLLKSSEPSTNLISIDEESQNSEQEIIFKFFDKHKPKYRFLVDVGAFGKECSKSYSLLKKGWKGFLIEAYPGRCKIIRREFEGLDFDLVNIGVGASSDRLPFYLHTEPAHNSFLHDWHSETLSGGKRIIDVLPLEMILDHAHIPVDFDFLTINASGLDYQILNHFFYASKYRPTLISTACSSYIDAFSFFDSLGYSLISSTGIRGLGFYFFMRNKNID